MAPSTTGKNEVKKKKKKTKESSRGGSGSTAASTAAKKQKKPQKEAQKTAAAAPQKPATKKKADDGNGEQARIQFALAHIDAPRALEQLRAKSETQEGLRALSVLFPAAQYPVVQLLKCWRCLNDFHEAYNHKKACKIKDHPEDSVFTEFVGGNTKYIWMCGKCDKESNDYDHGLPGPCFVGRHEADKARVADEGWPHLEEESGSESDYDFQEVKKKYEYLI